MTEFNLPILLITFNRPNFLKRQIQVLKELNARKIYFSSDGPRVGHPKDNGDIQNCRELIDMEESFRFCRKKYESVNLGCKNNVISSINWFFHYETEGVIIEDDCLFNEVFLKFAQYMLEKYRADPRVMHINGFNRYPNNGNSNFSFDSIVSVWGWATWRNAWYKYDQRIFENNVATIEIEAVVPWHLRGLVKDLSSRLEVSDEDTWDYQWLLTVIFNNGVTVRPDVSLIQNIGFDDSSTHTKSGKDVRQQVRIGRFDTSIAKFVSRPIFRIVWELQYTKGCLARFARLIVRLIG